jgi:hypothetical protein
MEAAADSLWSYACAKAVVLNNETAFLVRYSNSGDSKGKLDFMLNSHANFLRNAFLKGEEFSANVVSQEICYLSENHFERSTAVKSGNYDWSCR